MKKVFLILTFLLFVVGIISAKVTLPALVSDNMVLQQQSQVNVWGWSEPGAAIEVTSSWGEKASAKADDEGNWLVKIKTPQASFTPQSITVSDGTPVILKNILIGEVWLCSGQSNMEMALAGMWSSGVLGANQTIAESNVHPNIRLFNVKQVSSVKPEKDCVGSWNLPSPTVVKSFSAIGYLYALQLQKMLNVPVGIISSSWGGTIIEAWMDAESQKSFTDVDLNLLYDEDFQVYNKPISCYNGMLYPLFNYVVKGFLWYQGEGNVPRYSTYADKMVAMIKLWRSKWGNENLPFFYAEIAPYNYAANRLDLTEEQTKAALLREQQKNVMGRIDNVGMVCTNDLVFPYEENEIHPSNKPEVAKRFAYWAMNKVYGAGDAVSVLGPQYKTLKIDGNKAVVSFEGVVSIKGEITGFEIAGVDRIFYPAVATKENMFSQNLVVTSEKVDNPVAVRYCFRNFKLGNVTNSFGQPMVSFRTDNWEIKE
nr:sialate O-acetylesterase [uncultured Draconibacterium sp.]